ncbi:hypothetical protein RXV94_14180 [Yeosuana sp. MJ-SS3]|uniref:YhhN-like protein n=1 Tax=Gilvirhabdus luticola TaxID=3079858 RepID=A0ABU3UA93_9FLAO|nr:hypothetical protein [Yeosuana sp. MJ-SS3]MDU8887315.1 hypothetical protein [Yeosuana sp. MJ-SS3]
MSRTKLLVGFLIVLCILFVIFQFNENDKFSCITRSLIIPAFTVLYFQSVKRKTFYFSMFLVLYSISELTSLISEYIPYEVDYFMGNGLYIAAYVFLILEVLKSLNFNYVLNNYSIHLIVLGALNIYIVYVLLKIVYPFVSFSFEFLVELMYNIVMLILLSVSLLNYFYRDNRKSLLMFVGSLCLVFSEVILVAYLYISDKNLLIFSSSILSILAFYFFYIQASLKNEKVKSLANL